MKEILADNERTYEIVNEMYRQLGGQKFVAMTGATITYQERVEFSGKRSIMSLLITLPPKLSKNRVHKVYMHFMLEDTYTFAFFKKNAVTSFETVSGVYHHMIKDVFETVTGIKTTLN